MSVKKIIPLMLTALLMLAGCGSKSESDCRNTAEDYLPSLGEAVGDVLTLDGQSAEQYGETYVFLTHSEKYEDDFRIYVRPDKSVTDTYFSLSLQDSAKKECMEMVSRALPDFDGTVSAGVARRVSSSALSKRLFDSIYAAQKSDPYAVLLEIEIDPADATFSEEDLMPLLREIRGSGLSASVSVSGFPASYEVSGGEIYRISGGADGGAYIKKQPLT